MKTMKKLVRSTPSWPVAEAKARMSELIDRTIADGPQVITRKGREVVVVVALEEWKRKTKRKGNLAEFLADSPLHGSELRVERSSDAGEPIEL